MKGIIIMKRTLPVLSFAVATLFAGQAMALNVNTTPTRAEVQAELAQAINAGEMLSGDSSQTLREMYPAVYPSQPVAVKTRAEVRAELEQAVREGNVVTGESSATLSEMYPALYSAAQQDVAVKSRAQVQSELADAVRAGDMVSGQSSQTLNQIYPQLYPTNS